MEVVIAGFTMTLAASQKTEAVSSVSFSYTSGLRSMVNTSMKPNMLYNTSEVSDPGSIFSNITNNETIMSEYVFSSNFPVGVTVYVTVTMEVLSGTSPQWTTDFRYYSYTFAFNGTQYTRWVEVPFDLNGTLAHIQEINRQLNISSGDPTIVFNASESEFIGNSLALNHTSLELTVNYPLQFFSPNRNESWQYMQVTHDPNAWNNATSTVERIIPLPNDRSSLQTLSYISLAAAAAITGALLAGLQGRKLTDIETFIRKNGDNIIAVDADPLSTRAGMAVGSLAELTKLSDLSGQPIFMYSADGKCTLFAEYGSGIYYYSVRQEAGRRKRYRPLKDS